MVPPFQDRFDASMTLLFIERTGDLMIAASCGHASQL